MVSILRQIVAGPRARHEETGLDLCYVTPDIIATSGPSQAYPQRAYRNPLDRLVAFLDEQHGDDWAIWEFRAEGTGYPDEAVYGRIRHYPWPDHHPPPFRMVPNIMASMRNWLAGGELGGAGVQAVSDQGGQPAAGREATALEDANKAQKSETGEQTPEGVKRSGSKGGRVVVVHCKAGKGRSGSMACSFLVSEQGWTPEEALARFTERRMRPKFGAGVSIPSQLRWISYVDRWTKGGKHYTDRPIEIVEVHMWGLRNGVKVSIEGFVEEGKKIKVLHTFPRDERIIVEGDTPSAGTVAEVVPKLAKLATADAHAHSGAGEDPGYEVIKSTPGKDGSGDLIEPEAVGPQPKGSKTSRAAELMRRISKRSSSRSPRRSKGGLESTAKPSSAAASTEVLSSATPTASVPASASQSSLGKAAGGSEREPGGMAVIFRPKEPLIIGNSDVNIAVERRNKVSGSMGLMTMVTAVAHVWFNVFFEGNGPEQGGKADDSGVFEIEWDKMDGIKGSSQKGTRALDRLAVVWRTVDQVLETKMGAEGFQGSQGPETRLTRASTEIREPSEGEEVPQMRAADWKGDNSEDPEAEKHLGLRVQDPDSADVSKASSIKSIKVDEEDGKNGCDAASPRKDDDGDSLSGVKTSGPSGEALDESPVPLAASSLTGRKVDGGSGPEESSTADATAKNGFIVE